MLKSKKLIYFGIIIMLCITLVLSVEFDNIKNYDSVKKEVTIKNTFGMGSDVAKIKLDTPLVNYVIAGKDRLVAQMTFESYENYTNAFNNIKFYNKDTNNLIDRPFKYKVKTIEEVTVPVYESVCEEKKLTYLNGSKYSEFVNCIQKEKGNKTQKKEVWSEINKELGIKKGNITIGIFADVYSNDNVEWVPTLYGVEITEWATWTDSFNVGLKDYWKLDEFTGTTRLLNNVNSSGNGTNGNSAELITGVINKGIQTNDGGTKYWNRASPIVYLGNWSVGFWANMTSNTGIFIGDAPGSQYLYFSGANALTVAMGGSETATTANTKNNWNYYTVVYDSDSSTTYIYQNGSLLLTGGVQGELRIDYFGTYSAEAAKFSGGMDEIGIWNRTLSATEVSDLYNNGAGISYTDAPNVTLGNPVDFFNQTLGNQSIVLNCFSKRLDSTDDQIHNISLIINDVVNTTISNSSANQNLSLSQMLTFKDGNYNWYCNAANWGGQVGTSGTTKNFTIHHNGPLVAFYSQVPADINSTNIINNPANITYNITEISFAGSSLNTSTINIFYKSNSTTRDKIIFINGTSISWGNDTYLSNVSSLFLFQLQDNEIYPSTNNLNDELFDLGVHTRNQLPNSNAWVAIQLLNVTNTTEYNYFEIMSNGTSIQRLYYCNSSYGFQNDAVPNIVTSPRCSQITSIPANTPYNHCHTSESCHQVIPFVINTTTGKTLNGVKVTTTSYFFLRGNTPTNSLSYYSVADTSRTGAIRTTTNNGGTYTNRTYTVDSHLHQFTGNSSLWYYVCANDTTNNQNCSEIRQDLFDLGGLPPTSPNVYNPTTGFYKGNITINYTASVSPNGYTINYYNISLANQDGSFNKTIRANNSQNLSYVWDSAGNPDGSYTIKVRAFDNQSQSAVGTSDIFILDNTNPLITFISPTPVNYFNSSIKNFTVQVNVIEPNLANVTFDLFDSTKTLINTTTLSIFNSLGLCYQESVNVLNQNGTDGDCGLNYTGVTQLTGATIDGMFSSNNLLSGTNRLNYTKPSNISYGAVWRIKDSSGEVNITIPSWCFNTYQNKLVLSVAGGGGTLAYYCQNSTEDYVYFYTTASGQNFYEEGIYWDLTPSLTYFNLADGIYYYNATATGIANNINSTETRQIEIHTLNPQWTLRPTNKTINYQDYFNENFEATDSQGVNYSVNDSRFTINAIGNLTNNSRIGAGEYWLNVSVNDSFGLKNSTLYNLTILPISSSASLTFDKVSPQEYGVPLTPTCSLITGETTPTLKHNGELITSGVAILKTQLNVSTHNFNCSYLGTQNYTSSQFTYNFVITQGTPILTLLANGGTSNLTLNYIQQINVSATTNSTGTIALDNNGFDYLINNSVNATYSVGTYIFRANITGNVNYSDLGYSYIKITLVDLVPPTAEQGYTGGSGGSGFIKAVNKTFTNNATTNFTINSTDTIGLKNVTITVTNETGDVINETTHTFIGSVFEYIFGIPIFLIDGVYNWVATVYDSASNFVTTNILQMTVDTTNPTLSSQNLTVVWDYNSSRLYKVNTTINEQYIYDSGINFEGTNYSIYNITPTIFEYNFTKDLPYVPYSSSFFFWLKDNATNFNVSDTYYFNVNCPNGYVSVNGSFCMNIIPIVNVSTASIPVNQSWIINVTNPKLNECYYNTSDAPTTRETIVCNQTNITTWNSGGNKKVTYCFNTTLGATSCLNKDVEVLYFYNLQTQSANNVGEGTSVIFTLLVNNSELINLPTTTATFNLNGTQYSPDTTATGTQYTLFTKTITVLDGWGNLSGNILNWNWNFSVAGHINNYSTTTNNLTVFAIEFDDCSVNTQKVLNLTLRDEETEIILNNSYLNGTQIEIDLQISNLANSSIFFTYNNTWVNDTDGRVGICLPTGILNNSLYRIDFIISYVSTNHVKEFYYLDDGRLSLNNSFNSMTSKDIDLYDLLLTDSTSFLFTFFASNGLQVENAIVHTFRKYIGQGVFKEVERSKQDNNGQTLLHLVEEDVIYYFVVTLNGEVLFTSSNYNAKCLASLCSLELRAGSSNTPIPTEFDLVNNGTYSVTSNRTTRKVYLNYDLSSPANMNLTVFKYSNNKYDSTFVDSDLAYGSSGVLEVSIPISSGNWTYYAVVYKDGSFIYNELIDMTNRVSDYFGTTGLIMGSLVLLTIGLMAISEGVLLLPLFVFGLIVSVALGLINIGWYSLILIVCMFGILMWKLARRRS